MYSNFRPMYKQTQLIKMTVLLCLFLATTKSYTQIELHLPGNTIGSIIMYSYAPSKYPAAMAELIDGHATINISRLKAGMYSLYFTENQNIQNAPFIDLWITPEEASFEIYWAPEWPYLVFDGSPINTKYHQLKDEVSEWQTTQQKYFAANYYFVFASEAQVQRWDKGLDSLEQRRKSLSAQLEKEPSPYFRPLWFQLQDNSTLDDPNFTKNLHALDYQTSIITAYLNHLGKPYRSSNSAKAEEEFVAKVIKMFGATSDGFLYVQDWVEVNYDRNNSHDLHLFALTQLQESPSASSAQKQIWANLITKADILKVGEVFPVNLLPSKNIEAKDERLCIVLYSETCGFCAETLEKVNTSPDMGKRIAIRVKVADDQHSYVQAEKYPNVHFYFPEDMSPFSIYTPRGTPTVIYLKKESKKWKITGMD